MPVRVDHLIQIHTLSGYFDIRLNHKAAIPATCRQRCTASISSGMNRCTHRLRLDELAMRQPFADAVFTPCSSSSASGLLQAHTNPVGHPVSHRAAATRSN